MRSSSSNHRTELRSASARVGGCGSIEPIGGGGRHYRPSARRAVSGDLLSFCIHRARGGRRRGRAYCTTYVHRQLSPHAISEARLSVTVDKAASFNRLVCVWRLRINRIVRWERAIYEDTILLLPPLSNAVSIGFCYRVSSQPKRSSFGQVTATALELSKLDCLVYS